MGLNKNWLNPKDKGVSDVVVNWQEDLDNHRGERAELRRCKEPGEVIFVPAYYRLLNGLRDYGKVNNESVALVAGVLSHVKQNNTSEPFAAQLAQVKSQSDSPMYSEKRFRKLLSVRDNGNLYREMIRAVRQSDGVVNVPNLSEGLYWWNNYTRKTWAFAYYEKIV